MTLTEALLAVLILMGRGGGNGLVDYIPADAYWALKAIEPAPAAMLDLAAAEDGAATDPASRLGRLMAIRTLGEHRHAPAVAALRDIAGGDDAAAARQARIAIARITGQPRDITPPDIAATLRGDLALIPPDAAAVGGLRFVPASATPFDLGAELPAVAELLSATRTEPLSPEDVARGMALHLSSIAERVGNVRLDAVTLGVSGDLDAERFWAVAVIRGRWQRDRWVAMLRFLGRPVETLAGVPTVTLDHRVRVMLASDERLVLTLAGGGGAASPARLAAALRGGPAADAGPDRDIADATLNAPVWARVEANEAYREAILLANVVDVAIDSTLTPPADDGPPRINLRVDVAGDDAVELEMDAGFLRSTVRSSLDEVRRRRAATGTTDGAAVEALFESIRIEQDGPRVRVTGTWPGGTGLLVAAPAMMALRSPGPATKPAEPASP